VIYMVEMALLDTARRAEWDRTVERRGLTVVPAANGERFVGTPGVRVLRPLGLRLRRAG
jgi:hypothetical protein